MIQLKYTVEMEVPDDVMATIKGVKIDDVVQTNIENVLYRLCKGAIIVYRTDEGKRPIDLFQKCPACDHAWGKHFDQVTSQLVSIPDGKSLLGKEEGLVTIQKGTLTDPVPTTCGECVVLGKSCVEALKYK